MCGLAYGALAGELLVEEEGVVPVEACACWHVVLRKPGSSVF
jgi:hypothetical protein